MALYNSCNTCMRGGQTSLDMFSSHIHVSLLLSNVPSCSTHSGKTSGQTAATTSHLLIQITVGCEIKHVLTHLTCSSGEVFDPCQVSLVFS